MEMTVWIQCQNNQSDSNQLSNSSLEYLSNSWVQYCLTEATIVCHIPTAFHWLQGKEFALFFCRVDSEALQRKDIKLVQSLQPQTIQSVCISIMDMVFLIRFTLLILQLCYLQVTIIFWNYKCLTSAQSIKSSGDLNSLFIALHRAIFQLLLITVVL